MFGDSVERESCITKTNLRETAPLSGAPGNSHTRFIQSAQSKQAIAYFSFTIDVC